MDEKWAFVHTKEKNLDKRPDGDGNGDGNDPGHGDRWDHTSVDPGTKMVLSVVPGPRTAESTLALVADTAKRLGGKAPALITTDEYAAYKPAIEAVFGELVTPPRTGRPGRPGKPYRKVPDDMVYATVHKTRERGRVVRVESRIVFGTKELLDAALAASSVSNVVNTSFVERQNGTDRNRNARKARKTYCFSKDTAAHDAATYFTMYSYNFCWPVRTLIETGPDGRRRPRTPAMAAGLADHVWPLAEWLRRPAVQRT